MIPRLASFCTRRRWLVVVLWIAAFIGISFASGAAGDGYSQEFELNGADSQTAQDLIKDRFPGRTGDTGEIVFKAEAGIDDAAAQSTLTELFAAAALVDDVAEVRSPFAEGGERQIARGGQIGFAEIQFESEFQGIPESSIEELRSLAEDANEDGLQVELGGQVFQSPPELGSAELIGLAAAAIILLLAFGSVLAMAVPIVTALVGVGVGLSAVGLLAHVVSVPEFSTQLGAMIGIGVGIDYALFIVTRYRDGLRNGLDPTTASVNALNTSGRAVIFAGTTVVISLLGMLLIDLEFVQGIGMSAALVVVITMLASITLLPAILGFAGHKIDFLSLPWAKKVQPADHVTIWDRWSSVVQRRPLPIALAGLVVLVLLAVPMFSLRLGSSDEGNMPTTQTIRRGYDLKAEGFGPGGSATLVLVTELPDGSTASDLEPVVEAVRETDGVAFVSDPIPNSDGDTALIQVVPASSLQDAETTELLTRLREDVLPAATAGTGLAVHVGGVTALFEDLATQLADQLPIFIGTVLVLSFLLLMVVFRSVVVPLKAVVMNLLSIGAAYGVIVAVFQWGWGKDLVGIGKTGPVEAFLPIMMFAILFGLSMDYEVFLLSRIKEEYDRSGDNSKAVADGLRHTARVITAAALIMVCVFGSFMFGDERAVKMFGMGLAVAVLIDATIVRVILVPATMELLGKANWWMPKWLRWLPEVHVDGNDVTVEAELAEIVAADSGDPDDDHQSDRDPVGVS
ncbi:MAG TPA: MMPL family transporter [Microthrixaceae bacterium]|nr:MMPL family transporter [Microthrixaceae bacterium]